MSGWYDYASYSAGSAGAPVDAAYLTNGAVAALTGEVNVQALAATLEFTSTSVLPVSFTREDAATGTVIDVLRMRRQTTGTAGAGIGARLLGQVENDAGTLVDAGALDVVLAGVVSGSETGAVVAYARSGGALAERARFGATETVFNDASADVDFRIESNDNSQMFVVDAGENQVWIAEGNLVGIADVSVYVAPPTRTITATSNGFMLHIVPRLTEAASGTHSVLAGVNIVALDLTAGAAGTDDAASFRIAGAPSGATRNWSLWVDAGLSRFDAAVLIGATALSASELLNVAGAARIAGSTSTSFLEFDDGQAAAVSAAGEGRIRYNDATGTFQSSASGGAYAGLGGAPTDAAYLTNGAVAALTAEVDITAIGTTLEFTSTSTLPVSLTRSDATNTAINVLRLIRTTTIAPAASLGATILYQLEDSANATVDAGSITVDWLDATSTSLDSRFYFRTRKNSDALADNLVARLGDQDNSVRAVFSTPASTVGANFRGANDVSGTVQSGIAVMGAWLTVTASQNQLLTVAMQTDQRLGIYTAVRGEYMHEATNGTFTNAENGGLYGIATASGGTVTVGTVYGVKGQIIFDTTATITFTTAAALIAASPLDLAAGTTTITTAIGLLVRDQAGVSGNAPDTVTTPVGIEILAQTNGIGLRSAARILQAQGADVASAGDVTLGAGGNVFEITGTTGINAITTTRWQNGAVVVLVFAASVTVNHNTAGGANTAPILLSGAANFAATAGDTLCLVLSEQGGTQAWREVARTVI